MLYIFNSKDEFINIINEETGLLSTEFKDYQNELLDYPFTFFVDSESEHLPLIEKENQVAFYDRDNRLRLMRIKEISERSSMDGYVVEAKCEPSYLELYDHFIEDKRVNNGTAQTALDRALAGSRYTGEVTAELGNNTTNFYWINAVEAIFNIIEVWGGALLDTITLDNNNEIIERKIIIKERLGADNGLLIEPDYNAESIERKTLSYPITAMYAQGSSLEIEDDDGNHTGGYTRYITFEDAVWSKAKGDPVDKPKGQKWVGDPEALAEYGYVKSDGSRMHRFGHFSDQDYETPEELLQATWEALQQSKHPEISHEATINVDRKVSLGDTATILDRNYNKPIELQSQITGLEYDILAPNDDVKVVIGKYIDMSRDSLQDELDEIKKEVTKPRPTKPITNDSFPDIKPATPVNVTATGVFRAVLIDWEYDSSVYVSEYEVYASQVKDFVPDNQHLVYRGRVSAYGHEVGSQETWYYRVRSVNTRGTASEFSEEITANSIRIDFNDMEDEVMQEIDDAKDRAEEAYDNANSASQNAMDAIDKAQQGFDKAQDAITQAGNADNKANQALNKAQEVFDELEPIHTFMDDTGQQITTIKGDVTGLQTEVNKKVDNTTYNSKMTQLDNVIDSKVSQTDADNKYATQTQLTQTSDKITSRVEEIEGWEFGGVNLVDNSKGDTLDGWASWRGVASILYTSTTFAPNKEWIWVRNTSNNNDFGTHTPVFDMVAGETYTISFTIRSLSNSGYQLNYLHLRQQGDGRLITIKRISDVNMADAKFKGDIAGDGLRVWFTFSHDEDLKDARVLLGISGRPDGAGYVIRELQIEQGNKVTPWSPSINDTERKFSAIDQTVKSIATRVQETEDDYSTLSQTVEGFQTTIKNVEGDLNIVTNLANANQQSITNVNGKVNTLTQTVDATVSRIENGDTNLVTHDANKWETGSISTTSGGNTANSDSQYLRLIDYYPIESNREYTLTTYAGLLNGYETSYRINIYYYDATKNFIEFRSVSLNKPVTVTTPANTKYYRIRVSGLEMGGLPWFIEPNFMGSAIRIKLQRGAYSTDWTNHDSDVYSQYSQLQDAINLRVQKDDLISQINIDTSGVLISGKKLVLDGDTTVTGNFRVRSANIASIEAGKITGGTADFAKFTAINMRGLDIYGSRFRSSAGTDSMEITGGNIQLSLNNGRRLDISPTGFYGYNAGGSVRFQADQSLVTSAALGTSNYNVYLAAEDSGSRLGEVRAVKTSTLGGSGNSTDYEYIDIRARSIKSAYGRHFYIATDLGELRVMSQGLATQGVYRDVRANKYFGNELEVNGGSMLYLRTNSRVRIVGEGSSEDYSDLQTGKIQAHSIRNNTETSGTHFYVGTGSTSASELRVTTNGLWGGSHDDTTYTNIRASGYYGNTLDQHSGVGGTHIYVRPLSGGELRVTRTGTTTTYQAVRASAFNESSSRDYKTDIQPYEDSALDIINQLSVVNFRFKDDVESDIDDLKIGFIAEDSEPIASLDGKAIQTYKLGAYNTKAIQELYEQLNTQQQIIDSLMVKVAEMERKK